MAIVNRIRWTALHLWWTFLSVIGPTGWLAVVRIKLTGIVTRITHGSKGAEPIAVPMRELDGGDLYVRPATTDLIMAVLDYRHGLNLPPPEVASDPMGRIVELGVNAGAGMASLATRYPDARLLAAEPDPRNVALAERNVAPFGTRTRIVQTAIWDSDCDLAIEGSDAFGFTVREVASEGEKPAAGAEIVPALTIDSLLAAHAPGEMIDYMLMTIEGTEPRVLGAGGAWVRRVRSIRVEIHEPFGYLAEDCLAQLRALGFEARAIDLQGGWALGVRR